MTQFHAGTRGADESQGPGATSSGTVSAFLRCDTTAPPASFPRRSVHGAISCPANLKRVLLVADALFQAAFHRHEEPIRYPRDQDCRGKPRLDTPALLLKGLCTRKPVPVAFVLLKPPAPGREAACSADLSPRFGMS